MYTAWLSTKDNYPMGRCVYDNSVPEAAITFIDPNLNLIAGAAGEFTFGIAPTQLYYNSFEKMTSIITIVRDGKIVWEGRIIDEEMDFFKTKNFSCEGAMAYFNDTIQDPSESGTDLRVFLNEVIQRHNIQAGTEKHKIFKLGQISQEVIPTENFTTNYENTLEVLNKIVEEYGGYFHITWDEYGEKVLNYYSDTIINTLPPVVQSIEFGKNLLDYTHSYDLTELCTVVVPVGADVTVGEDEEGKEIKKPLTLDMWDYEGELDGHVKGTAYVLSEEAVQNYGWIAKKLEFNDVTDPEILYYLSKAYLEKGQFAKMNIEISAFDMALLNKKIDGLPAIKKEE